MQEARPTLTGDRGRAKPGFAAKPGRCLTCLGIAAGLSACASAAETAGPATGTDRGAEAGEAGTVVRMYPTAVVAADQVTLADVAQIRGEAARLATSWPVARAPKAGANRVVELAHVQKVLARRGANLAHWVFRGHTHCTVSRPAGPAGGRVDLCRPLAPHQSNPNEHRAGVGERAAGVGPTADAIDPNTLGGVLHEHICQRLANLGGVPLIEFTPAVTRLLGLAKPTYDFQVADRSDRLVGFVRLGVTIYERDQVKQVLEVLANVSLRKGVVVAARQINRGQTIGSRDLAIEDRVFDRIETIGLTDKAPLVGQRAKHFIREGQQLGLRDVEPIPLVRRNDLVTVIVRRGNLMIRGSARALSSGGYGDVVELKNEMAKRSAPVFTAVVTAHKTVEIPARDRKLAAAPALNKGDL